MENVKQTLPGELLGPEVEAVCHRLRDKQDPSSGRVHHEQETVRAGSDQVLDLSVREERRLVVTTREGVI